MGPEDPKRSGGNEDQSGQNASEEAQNERHDSPPENSSMQGGPTDGASGDREDTGGSAAHTAEHAHAAGRSVREENIYQLISRMNVADKIRYAVRAPKEGRTLLLKDPNKLVSVAAIQSPKITVEEVELVAKSKSVDEELLRLISKNREWLRHYPIVLHLVTNPKTPLGISMSLMQSIQTRDLVNLSKSRAISSALKSAAIRLLQVRQKHG